MPKSKEKKTGRPAGSKNCNLEVDAPATRCPVCRSTDRGPYFGKTEQFFRGLDASGQPYTHIVRRRCRCEKCGQIRIDRTYEYQS